MYIQEFEARTYEKEINQKNSKERAREVGRIGREIIAHQPQSKDFVYEQGIELSEKSLSRGSWPKDQLTPFINYWGVDLAIYADGREKFSLIVISSEENRPLEYAVASYSSIFMKNAKELTEEAREAAEEEVVDIFQAVARCFGIR